MDNRITAFLAAARSCALSPMEHAEARAELVAHTVKAVPTAILRESSDALQLTDYEKAIGRARLLNFMRINPVDTQRWFRMFFRPLTASLSSALVLLLAGGGVAYAAEGSMPGDLLYPVKVHITEPIISGLSLTSARRAQWNIQTIERRLNESNALNQKPNSTERQAILHSQMEENVASLGEHLRDLSAEDKKTVRKDLLSELTRHRETLQQMQGGGIPAELRTLAEEAAADLNENDDQKEKPHPANQEVKSVKERRRAIISSPEEEDEGTETSSLSSSSSSELINISSSAGKRLSITPRGDEDSLSEDDEEDAAQSLLRILRENRSSRRSSLSISPSSEHPLETPDEEMEEDE